MASIHSLLFGAWALSGEVAALSATEAALPLAFAFSLPLSIPGRISSGVALVVISALSLASSLSAGGAVAGIVAVLLRNRFLREIFYVVIRKKISEEKIFSRKKMQKTAKETLKCY